MFCKSAGCERSRLRSFHGCLNATRTFVAKITIFFDLHFFFVNNLIKLLEKLNKKHS